MKCECYYEVTSRPHQFVYCPTHAAAEEMVEIIRAFCTTHQMNHPWESARALLARLEGKE